MASNVFEAIGDFRDGVKSNVITQQNLAITMDVNKPGNGASVSPYYVGDYTYPQYFNMTTGLTGSTGAQSTGTAHTHTNGGAAPFAQNYIFAVNTAIGAYITATSPYVIDRISLSTYLITSSAGGTVPLQIYREAADGSLVQLFSNNIKSALPVGTQGVVTELQLATPIIVAEGERYLIRVANLTSPGVNMAIAGLSYSGNASPNTMHKTTTSTLATQTSFTTTEANTALAAGVILPWIALGQTASSYLEDRTWWDDFNRIYLGRRWLQANSAKTGDLKIVDGQLTYDGTTNGIQEAIFTRPTTGDAIRADVDMHGVNASGNIDVFICRDRESMNGVNLSVYELGAIIGTTINATQTTRATYTGRSNEATWSIYYEPTPDKYTVLKDGQDIGLTWTDTSHVFPHGPNYRFSSVMIECASGIPGGTLDNWVFRDWTP